MRRLLRDAVWAVYRCLLLFNGFSLYFLDISLIPGGGCFYFNVCLHMSTYPMVSDGIQWYPMVCDGRSHYLGGGQPVNVSCTRGTRAPQERLTPTRRITPEASADNI